MLIVLVLVSSMTAYFMNTYNVVIDDSMIRNTLQTDIKESMDLFSIKQVLYVIFLGLLPAYLIYKTPIKYASFKTEFIAKLKQLLILLIFIGLIVFLFFKPYASFVREYKPLRFTTNPLYWIYSIGYYTHATFSSGKIVVKPIGEDAKVIKKEGDKPKIVILVVGEATRADHLSLNGYKRETTPQLKKEGIINFSNVYSCGTATASSVPCMFSIYERADYSYKKGIQTENVLDVLKHTDDVSILWRDNNSDSKGVALRVAFENYKNSTNNTECTADGECRDEGMLVGLDKYIKAQKGKDILIILHQMGNHGPAYYKRYPKAFEKYTPVCKTNQLEECTREEINNAYDNAILYTDDFLTKTIGLLKKYGDSYKTAMIYLSDHGESLGEKGIYLHGLPYFMAPDAQTHIGALMWMNAPFKNDFNLTTIDTNKKWTQDYLFHSLLRLFNVQTKVYDPKLDIFKTGAKDKF